MPIIHYLPACAGAGKTHAIEEEIKLICDRHEKVLVVQPTMELIDKTVLKMQSRFPSVVVQKFHSGSVAAPVSGKFQDYMKRPLDCGHVVFVTWASFEETSYIHEKSRWHLIIDEIPNATPCDDIALANEHGLITSSLDVEAIGVRYGVLKVRDKAMIRSLAENRNRDQVRRVIQPLARRLRSFYYQNYVDYASYHKLINSTGANRKLTVFSTLLPSICCGYASVLMSGARAEETILFKLWSREGVDFRIHKPLMNKLRYQTHQNGHLIQLRYGSERNWSKNLANADDNTLMDDLIKQAQQAFFDKEFLCLRNKGCEKTEVLFSQGKAIPLPGWSHGLNDYLRFNDVVVTGAYNLIPSHHSFLQEFCNICPSEVKIATMNHLIYQAISRCSIRDPDNVEPKLIILPDRATAEWCQTIFPGSSCESLDIDLAPVKKRGRPSLHKDSKDRKKISRDKIKGERQAIIEHIRLSGRIDLSQEDEVRDINAISDISNNVSRLKGTIVCQRSYEPQEVILATDAEFVGFLRHLAKRTISQKTDNKLISPALFDACRSYESNTGNANVMMANGMWFDVDRTDLTPKKFADLFPSLSIYTYETFSSTHELIRFRVWIPTSDIMTNEEYRTIYLQIVRNVETSGYPNQKKDLGKPKVICHGIEKKPNASDKFFLPCKTADGRTKTFKAYEKGNRKPLDVEAWLDNPICGGDANVEPIALPSGVAMNPLTPVQERIRETALDEFRCVQKGDGHSAFYRLHLRLLHNGIRGVDYELTMLQGVQSANSPNERIKDFQRWKKFAW